MITKKNTHFLFGTLCNYTTTYSQKLHKAVVLKKTMMMIIIRIIVTITILLLLLLPMIKKTRITKIITGN